VAGRPAAGVETSTGDIPERAQAWTPDTRRMPEHPVKAGYLTRDSSCGAGRAPYDRPRAG
jgi:hypothetical protein